MTAAETCRKNGWSIGTRLRGTESGDGWSRTSTIQITAIGESTVLAKTIAQTLRTGSTITSEGAERECPFDFSRRDWQVVPQSSQVHEGKSVWRISDATVGGVLYGPLPSKSNSRKIVRWGRRMGSIKSAEARTWTARAVLILTGARRIMTFDPKAKLFLTATVWQESLRRDLDVELLCDAIQKAGVIKNDRQFFHKEATRRISKNNPRVEWTVGIWEDIE